MRRINVVILKEQSEFLDKFKKQNNLSSNDKAINKIIDVYKEISFKVLRRVEQDESLIEEMDKLGVS